MTGQETLARGMPVEKFLAYMHHTYLAGDRLDRFLSDRQSLFTGDDLRDFLKTQLMVNQLQIQWHYESGNRWPTNRTAVTAMRETIIHSISTLHAKASNHLDIQPIT